MHILCPICSDLVNQADNIYVTKCGHIFHFHCLSQWIERSKSCPQCRHKVTDRCMFRLYPTISNENSGENVATLQSRLDDTQLQLRQQRATFKEQTDELTKIQAELKKNVELLKSTEKKLDSRDSAVAALKEQLLYLKAENNEIQKLKVKNEDLKKSIQTLTGLQKVLNATSDEVEEMLKDYTDIKTVAVFATALKRALCESESKKNESRDMLHKLKNQMSTESKNSAKVIKELMGYKEKYITLSKHCQKMKRKRRAEEAADCGPPKLTKTTSTSADTSADTSVNMSVNMSVNTSVNTDSNLDDAIIIDEDDGASSYGGKTSADTKQHRSSGATLATMVSHIEGAASPYLQLRQSGLALAALQQRPGQRAPRLKPSEFGILNFAKSAVMKSPDVAPNKLSIFHKKPHATISLSQERESDLTDMNISYDGLGGHSKLDRFPVPSSKPAKSYMPKLSAKHKLKRPAQGNKDISEMFSKIPDK